MPYILIKKIPIFLHSDLWEKVTQAALGKDNTAAECLLRAFVGDATAINKRDKYVYEYLNEQYQQNPRFIDEFCKFDMYDSEASGNVTDLLYDYCCLYGHSRIVQLQGDYQRIIDDYMGNSYSLPMGKMFCVEYFGKCSLANRIFRTTPKAKVRAAIFVDKIQRIQGDLRCFDIYYRDAKAVIRCGPELCILGL